MYNMHSIMNFSNSFFSPVNTAGALIFGPPPDPPPTALTPGTGSGGPPPGFPPPGFPLPPGFPDGSPDGPGPPELGARPFPFLRDFNSFFKVSMSSCNSSLCFSQEVNPRLSPPKFEPLGPLVPADIPANHPY